MCLRVPDTGPPVKVLGGSMLLLLEMVSLGQVGHLRGHRGSGRSQPGLVAW